jgi:archaellum component FlaC
VLADSRDEPLRSEMLSLLQSEEAPDAAYDASSSAAAEAPVFFIVSGDGSVVSADSVDFDIMAATNGADGSPLAAGEESVAEITIGETEGSSIMRLFGRSAAEDDAGRSIWSRIWSAKKGGTEAASTEADRQNADETPAAEDASGMGAIVADSARGSSTDSDAESAESAERVETGAAIPVHAEHSVDYLPGSVAESYDLAAVDPLDQANHMPEEAHSVILAGKSANLPGITGKLDIRPTQPAAGPKQGTVGRKERRRQERAEKKRQKKFKRSVSRNGADLPEIVLSAREDTDTLSPETVPENPAMEASVSSDSPANAEIRPVPGSGPEQGEAAVESRPSRPHVVELELTADPEGPAEDYAMIIAGGDMGLSERAAPSGTPGESAAALDEPASCDTEAPPREDATAMAEVDGDMEVEDEVDVETAVNVILFPPPTRSGDEWTCDAGEDGRGLRLLSMENMGAAGGKAEEAAVGEAVGETFESAPEVAPGALPPLAQLSILRALASAVPEYGETAEEEGAESQHVVMTPERHVSNATDEAVAAALADAEQEHQSRLDEFAKRLLELQGAVAEGEARLSAKADEVDEREALLRQSERKLQNNLETIRSLNRDLDSMRGAKAKVDAELKRLEGLHSEHERLYKEFEDLRQAYNEVVGEVLPSLQNERDELVLSVERQAEDEEKLRRLVKCAGRKVAGGYSLAAAAAVMMVVLPLMHWLKSSDLEKSVAANLQELSQWRERAVSLDQENKEYQSKMVDMEMAMLQTNRKIEKLENSVPVAVRPPLPRAPVKVEDASTLSGPVNRDGKPRVNGVRDPSGEIGQVLAQNRERYVREDAKMALRPQAPRSVQASAAVRTESASAGIDSATSREKGQIATVKKGEGVAQVVYRVLGSRDPEVIDWVIRENKLKRDRRNNPVIFPDQKLRLPAAGATVQAASAARR